MATDKSEPKTGLIFRIGFLAIIILLSLRAALISYFGNMASAEEERKIGQVVPEALNDLRADEKQRLSSGSMPVEKAMQEIVARGRMASPDTMPSASKDVAPLQGWTKMPGEVPPAMTAEPAMSMDAGAPGPASAGPDGGTHKPADGGAPKKPAKKLP
jgi:hypothetical protein